MDCFHLEILENDNTCNISHQLKHSSEKPCLVVATSDCGVHCSSVLHKGGFVVQCIAHWLSSDNMGLHHMQCHDQNSTYIFTWKKTIEKSKIRPV